MPTARHTFRSRLLLLAGFSTLLTFSLTACKSNPAPIVNSAAADSGGPDPADANMASASGQPTQVMGQSQSYTPQQQGQSYQGQSYQQTYPAGQQAPAPVVQGNAAYPQQQGYADYSGQSNYNQGYTDGEAAEAATAPPPLPVYDQPAAPDPNDIWTPGYWNYADTGYYWVPGAWVAAPYYGALWTPPYWGWYGNRYRFHHGYWGPHIGYYGGIDYGFGYIGVGYYGGYWRGHDFYYNRSVNHLGGGFRNVYERPVVVNNVRYNMEPHVRVSFNGGPGGINAQPRPFEVAAERERHEGPLPAQVAMRQQAATNRGNFFAANGGRPAQAAFAHPPAVMGGVAGRPGEPNGRPGAPGNPAGQPLMNRPNEVGNHVAPGNQPFNRPNEVGNRPGEMGGNRPGAPGTPGNPGNPGNPGAQPFNRPNEASAHPGSAGGNPGFNRPGEPAGHPAVGANPAINHGAEPANRPGGFNAPANQAPQHIGQPAAGPAFNHGGEPGGRPAGAPGGGFNRPAPAAAPQHIEAPRAAPAPQHVEAPRAAPAPQHMEAPRAAPAPQQHMEAPRAAPAAAPHVEAPHGPPAGGGGHPEGGGHPGPR